MSNGQTPTTAGVAPSKSALRALGLFLLIISLALLLLIVEMWPVREESEADDQVWVASQVFFKITSPHAEILFVLVAILGGALGSYVQAATSFATFAGNRTLVRSWMWWYVLRAPIGGVLALIFYAVLRGGFLTVSAGVDQISAYGVVAISGLVGMFSKQAIDKLKELFDTLFKTPDDSGDDARKDKPGPHEEDDEQEHE